MKMPKSVRSVALLLAAASFTLLAGCRMSAPVHLWEPPRLRSTVGQTVMVPRIVGPAEITVPVHDKLIQAAPSDEGRATRLVASATVEQAVSGRGGIALASYNPAEESDLALSSAARSEGIDFILRGEVLADRRPQHISESGDRLTVSWRLMPVVTDPKRVQSRRRTGMPVIIELEEAFEKYPDLKLAADKETVLQTALIRETLPLIIPSVQRHDVQLEIPYLVPASRTIRKGNAMALAGRWGEAESYWDEARGNNSFSSVAIHNLAIAAVARQDFSTARELAQKAVRMKPSKLHKRTVLWVERVQRSYHEAFELPDPPEGWHFTRQRQAS